MASESEFLDKAKRVLTLHDRLQGLFAKGKVTGERYAKHKESVDRMLSSLRADNLKLINDSLAEIDKALQKAESDRNAGVIDDSRFHLIRRDLGLRKADLESDRDAMELCEGEDYVTCLRRQMEEKKYEHYGGSRHTAKDVLSGRREMPEGQGLDDSIPSWAWITILLMLVIPFVVGLAWGSTPLAIGGPIIIVVDIAIMTGVLHMATVAVGVLTASKQRAFVCVMMYCIMSLVSAAFILALLGVAIVEMAVPQIGGALLVVAWIAVVVLAVFIPIYCVYSTYDSTLLQAILVILLCLALAVIIAVIIGVLFGPSLEGLVVTLPHKTPIM